MSSNRGHSKLEYRDLLEQHNGIQRKLQNKVEAVLMVSEELGKCQEERDKWEHLAVDAQTKLEHLNQVLQQFKQDRKERDILRDREKEDLQQALASVKNQNRRLDEENIQLRSQLRELTGDTKILRQKLARIELGNSFEEFKCPTGVRTTSMSSDGNGSGSVISTTVATSASPPALPSTSSSSIGKNQFTFHNSSFSSSNTMEEMEKLREEVVQMERDLRGVLCEKEELISEREEYKSKCDRLSNEMSFIMNGDEKRVVMDVDGILAENRYLKAQLESAQEETGLTRAALNKYRNLIESKKKVVTRTSSSENNQIKQPTIVTPKQVRELLGEMDTETTDYRALATALFESVKDKSLALSHQRKTNKILGQRIRELEKRSGVSPVPPPSPPPNEPTSSTLNVQQ